MRFLRVAVCYIHVFRRLVALKAIVRVFVEFLCAKIEMMMPRLLRLRSCVQPRCCRRRFCVFIGTFMLRNCCWWADSFATLHAHSLMNTATYFSLKNSYRDVTLSGQTWVNHIWILEGWAAGPLCKILDAPLSKMSRKFAQERYT